MLQFEDVKLPDLAKQFGTPYYVYSRKLILDRLREYEQALSGIPHLLCFAVKANSNLSVLRLIAGSGAGFDIVSGGELYRARAAGAQASKIVFSGVGKTEDEIRYALREGIHSFNCESECELRQISGLAKELKLQASVAIRVNPDVDASTHPYISTGLREHKFGVAMEDAEDIYLRASKLSGIHLEGVSCHIGSQLLDTEPIIEAAKKIIDLVMRLRVKGVPIRYLDLGGGLGVPYRQGESPVAVGSFLASLRQLVEPAGLFLLLEPGRSIVAEAGTLVTRVLLVKQNGSKQFVIVDAAMNDLIRPALYQAHHEIVLVADSPRESMVADIVGPVCETGDFFARNRAIPRVKPRDLLAIQTAGAYGFVQSSNYNSRPRVCELLVDGSRVEVVRRRETYEDLVRLEQQPTSDTSR